jgi:hypothetical protein
VGGFTDTIRIITGQTTNGTIEVPLGGQTPSGQLDLTINSDLQNPIEITFTGFSETLEEGEEMTVTAVPSVSVDNYQWYLNGELLEEATTDTVTLGSELNLGAYRLDCIVDVAPIFSSESIYFTVVETPTGFITGVITDNSTGTSGDYIAGVYDSNWYWNSQLIASTVQSNDGAFAINGIIPEGDYYIMVYRDSNGNDEYDYRGDSVEPMGEYSMQRVTITSAGLSGVNMTIQPRSISGTVSGVTTNWRVRADGPGVDYPWASIAADGSYTLNLYRPGNYDVIAYDPDSGAESDYTSNPVDLINNTQVENIDIDI